MYELLLKCPLGLINDSSVKMLTHPINIWDKSLKDKGMFRLKKHLSNLGINNDTIKIKKCTKLNVLTNNNTQQSNNDDKESITNIFDFKKNVFNWKSKIRDEDINNKENMLIFDLLSKMKKKKSIRIHSNDKPKQNEEDLTILPPNHQIEQETQDLRQEKRKANYIKKNPEYSRLLMTKIHNSTSSDSKDASCTTSLNYCETKIANNNMATTTNSNDNHHSKHNSALFFPSINSTFNILIQKANEREQDSKKLLKAFKKLNIENKVKCSTLKKNSSCFQSKASSFMSCTNITELNNNDKIPKLFSSMDEKEVLKHYHYQYIKPKHSKQLIIPRVNINKLKLSEYWNLD